MDYNKINTLLRKSSSQIAGEPSPTSKNGESVNIYLNNNSSSKYTEMAPESKGMNSLKHNFKEFLRSFEARTFKEMKIKKKLN